MTAQGDSHNAAKDPGKALGLPESTVPQTSPPSLPSRENPAAKTAPPSLPRRRNETPLDGTDAEQQPNRLVRPWPHELALQTPAWLASMVVHMAMLILLAWFTLPSEMGDDMLNHLVASSEADRGESLEHLEDTSIEELDLETIPRDVPTIEHAIVTPSAEVESIEAVPPAPMRMDFDPSSWRTAPLGDAKGTFGAGTEEPLGMREGNSRAAAVAKYGGTKESEAAVAAALKWLAAHQMADGGWSFAHQLAPECRGRCRNPGENRFVSSRNAATGMALLPFLGAGQTHRKGQYQKTVQAGLYFLASRQNPQTGSLWEDGGRMYSHGIASIALCEAYAMTRDPNLRGPAQGAINFIVYAQDPVGGGWRYDPQQPGDTSVLGWQLMALKSGHMAYLNVPAITVRKALQFLDSVQSVSGANYGYTGPGQGPTTEATTAIGLLCRMYLGAKKTDSHLENGTKWLGKHGPNKNLYYDYYATQVMRHWEGEPWTKWNAVMRDELVNSQAKRGHEAGSWFIAGGNNPQARHNQTGGRLYCTAMATMILEVYYRHMPIYAQQSTESDFPLE
ncbi:MAG TPA: hypothetical protein DD670_06820 [Planctomycetaceae bacterium]|nr:hypothetical protein [Planctomycetaceae bacterium]